MVPERDSEQCSPGSSSRVERVDELGGEIWAPPNSRVVPKQPRARQARHADVWGCVVDLVGDAIAVQVGRHVPAVLTGDDNITCARHAVVLHVEACHRSDAARPCR